MSDSTNLDQRCIDTIRTLSMDAVQAANSGHPGTPVALAPIAYTLWQRFLRYDPADPTWPNRDRFVLSAGHASMLLYSLLHLAQVKKVGAHHDPSGGDLAVSLDDIKHFRQLNSATPGHPEYHLTSGVETTTGPLGQGVATSVGMAIGARWLGARYNQPGQALFDYNVYVICGDGDLMEGVSYEAASLAGHLKLSNLCWIYDSNRITIEGSTDLAFSEDVATRFLGQGWNVLHLRDANDTEAFAALIEQFQAETDRPTLIIAESHIAWGTKLQDSHKAHGEPLGQAVIDDFKQKFGLPAGNFVVADGVYENLRNGLGRRGQELHATWSKLRESYASAHPELARELDLIVARDLPAGWDQDLPSFPADATGLAGRIASNKVQQVVAKHVPWLIGGAADLAPSTKTLIEDPSAGTLSAGNPGGRNFHFGIREHAMTAATNGLSLTGVRPYAAGFFIFSDYARASIRLSSIMELPNIYIFTHDSIGVGEDGPTHQPIEHLASLRAMPGLYTVRPGDANEVTEAWKFIMGLKHNPAALVLTRQNVPTIDRAKYAPASGLQKGGYVLADPADGSRPEVILIATGSEVSLAVAAFEKLAAEGVKARVVSLPCWELFEQQDAAYKAEVLPPDILARVSIEKGATFGWERYVGLTGAKIGMVTFGASAPLKSLLEHFGFTEAKVVAAAKAQVELHQAASA
jgi:transketolase